MTCCNFPVFLWSIALMMACLGRNMYRQHCYTSYLINIGHLLVLHHCSNITIYKEKACHLASVYFEKHGLMLVVACLVTVEIPITVFPPIWHYFTKISVSQSQHNVGQQHQSRTRNIVDSIGRGQVQRTVPMHAWVDWGTARKTPGYPKRQPKRETCNCKFSVTTTPNRSTKYVRISSSNLIFI